MSSQEFLVVLVVDIFHDKQAANVVNQSVGLGGVEMDSVGVRAIVSNGVRHL